MLPDASGSFSNEENRSSSLHWRERSTTVLDTANGWVGALVCSDDNTSHKSCGNMSRRVEAHWAHLMKAAPLRRMDHSRLFHVQRRLQVCQARCRSCSSSALMDTSKVAWKRAHNAITNSSTCPTSTHATTGANRHTNSTTRRQSRTNVAASTLVSCCSIAAAAGAGVWRPPFTRSPPGAVAAADKLSRCVLVFAPSLVQISSSLLWLLLSSSGGVKIIESVVRGRSDDAARRLLRLVQSSLLQEQDT
mmetsp:Transcript_12358/g.45087  ORF Transcript_12358/g.45087 Transcript_12358/m.45087 type:complete len:248 (-) Transcript_12358:56-799(-)